MEPDRGLMTNPALAAEGWQRRYLADESRAKEAEETYRAAGFEVLLHRLKPDDFGDKCVDCAASVCASYVVVYTRRPRPQAASKKPEQAMILSEVRMQGAELRITLNRPKANILDAKMIAAIQAALERDVNERTALIVFEGQGDHFCFGASVEEHRAEQAGAMLESFHALFKTLATLGVPTCAIVRGQCLGGGLELASWCTWIIAEPGATLGQPEIKLAVFPPMASILLPWRCGGAQGLDLCVSGRSISAERALEIGLVNVVTDDPEAWLKSHVGESLARTSASSLRFAEKAARIGLMHDIEHSLPKLERLYLHELMATDDANEGITAFIERRKPTFKHS